MLTEIISELTKAEENVTREQMLAWAKELRPKEPSQWS